MAGRFTCFVAWFYYSGIALCQVFHPHCACPHLSFSLSNFSKPVSWSGTVNREASRVSSVSFLTSFLQALRVLRQRCFGACGMYSCNSALTSATRTSSRPGVTRASSSISSTGAACTCLLASSLPATCTRLRRTTLAALQCPCVHAATSQCGFRSSSQRTSFGMSKHISVRCVGTVTQYNGHQCGLHPSFLAQVTLLLTFDTAQRFILVHTCERWRSVLFVLHGLDKFKNKNMPCRLVRLRAPSVIAQALSDCRSLRACSP